MGEPDHYEYGRMNGWGICTNVFFYFAKRQRTQQCWTRNDQSRHSSASWVVMAICMENHVLINMEHRDDLERMAGLKGDLSMFGRRGNGTLG